MKQAFFKVQSGILITKSTIISNKNSDILGVTLINIGGTEIIFNEKLQIPPIKNGMFVLFSETDIPYLNKDTKIEFKTKNTINKAYLSITRRIEKEC